MKRIHLLRSILLMALILAAILADGSSQVEADGTLGDGPNPIGQQYGATRSIDVDADAACTNTLDRGDLIDFHAYSHEVVSGNGNRWFFAFVIDSAASLTTDSIDSPTYIIVLDDPASAGANGLDTIPFWSNTAPYSTGWTRNMETPGTHFVGCYPKSEAQLQCALYNNRKQELIPPWLSWTVDTAVRGGRRYVEVAIPDDADVPLYLRNNSPINAMVISTYNSDDWGNPIDAVGRAVSLSCHNSQKTGGTGRAFVASDLIATQANCKSSGRPTDNGANARQCLSSPRRDAVHPINPGATCSQTINGVWVDGEVDSAMYTLLAEDTYAGPYSGGQEALSDFDGESAAYKYYADSNAGTSTFGSGSNLYDISINGAKKGAADVERVYARADSEYLYLIIEGPSALGGLGSMTGEPTDRSNLYIALDTPRVVSSTDTGGTAAESANAPASRRVNFKGWAPDYVIEVVWAGDDTTADNVHLYKWTSSTTWVNRGDFQTVLGIHSGPTSGPRLFGRSATGDDGDRKGRYEFAFRWNEIGGVLSSTDQLRLSVYTTGDSNLSGGADDWDVFDQGPGIGQGGSGLGGHEQVGDDPGDGDSSSQSGGESDEVGYVGQTDITTDVEPASDRTSRDVDTIEGYYVFTPNAQLISCSPLALSLATMSATVIGNSIEVTWDTVSEVDHAGFNLYRDTTPDGPGVRLNGDLIPSQGSGSPEGFHYSYRDTGMLEPDTTYYYTLEDVELGGVATRHESVGVLYSGGPTAIALTGFTAAAAGQLLVGLAMIGGVVLIGTVLRRQTKCWRQ